MDPAATAQLILDAIEAGDRGAKRAAMADLRDWYNRGGFVPKAIWASLPWSVVDAICFPRSRQGVLA